MRSGPLKSLVCLNHEWTSNEWMRAPSRMMVTVYATLEPV